MIDTSRNRVPAGVDSVVSISETTLSKMEMVHLAVGREGAALEWLGALGHHVMSGSAIVPGEPAGEAIRP